MKRSATERIGQLVPGIEPGMPNGDDYELIANKLEAQNEALKLALEALENILSEYAEDIYDQDYNPHQNLAFRIANEALTEISKLLGKK